ncbi:hydroxyacid dehydrogenase [Arcobacter sp. CECT 8989]|uniref:D-2-hydroxyacid dehydrogenase n=1 Tax=Arcobacter sp. CECT 8989 TaxID=2044509 RepID=UPI00100AF06C|nr:D-2-hydroxyacid dehydrogenase [Arcobacter sp. CECT 8989]RXJ98449.1 hydroxyacid dehydrogenase [Arcobacter sp. CECT 8989]
MEIVFLDRKTLGNDISLEKFNELGNVTIYETTSEDETLERIKNCDVVITNKVVITKEIMNNSDIKLICVTATGTNNVDIEYAKKNGIEVKNVVGYAKATVAQLTITLALHFIQKLDYYKNYVENGGWGKSDIFTHLDEPFYELENRNWGIIGLGNIGQRVANIAKAFECNVNYYSTSGKNSNSKFNQMSIEKLLKTSDIISIHSPLNDATANLINKSNLSLLKDGAILINVGRGGIINEEDLAKRLDEEKILYCGLDVVEYEPIKENNPLNKIEKKNRLVITPHIAWASIEARNKIINTTFENIKSFID